MYVTPTHTVGPLGKILAGSPIHTSIPSWSWHRAAHTNPDTCACLDRQDHALVANTPCVPTEDPGSSSSLTKDMASSSKMSSAIAEKEKGLSREPARISKACVLPAHISLVKVRLMATPNLQGVERCNPDDCCGERIIGESQYCTQSSLFSFFLMYEHSLLNGFGLFETRFLRDSSSNHIN